MRAVVATSLLAALAATAAGATAVPPKTVTARAASARATLVYYAYPDDYGRPRPRLTILRDNGRRYFEVVQPHVRDRNGRVIPFGVHHGGESTPLRFRDLDRDGEPEVVLDLFWGGSRCCLWTRIYRFDRAAGRYVPSSHFWGNFQDSYRVRDLDGDGRAELVAADGRIAVVSSSYYSADPIQIWSYRRGRFLDVTRRFPRAIARDARRWWATYVGQRRGARDWVREPLAAWVADQHLLGRARRADRMLAAALRSGVLDLPDPAHGVSSSRYVTRLHAFLRKNGYTVSKARP